MTQYVAIERFFFAPSLHRISGFYADELSKYPLS